jgi:hypothetical protein
MVLWAVGCADPETILPNTPPHPPPQHGGLESSGAVARRGFVLATSPKLAQVQHTFQEHIDHVADFVTEFET